MSSGEWTPTPLRPIESIHGGEGEIRTHGTLTSTTVFKTVALNHSATSPRSSAVAPFYLIPNCSSLVWEKIVIATGYIAKASNASHTAIYPSLHVAHTCPEG